MITKICTKCGTEKTKTDFHVDKQSKDGFKSSCKLCANALSTLWRKDNQEKLREQKQKYYDLNKYKLSEYKKKWYAANRIHDIELSRKWQKENEKRVSENKKQWRLNNAERDKENHKRYVSENRDKYRMYDKNRRARKIGSCGAVSVKEWEELKKKHNNKCLCCGRDDVKLTMDHVIPISKGGPNTIDNIQPLCKSCNCSKHAKHIDYRSVSEIGVKHQD
jgi:hypothetical protein